MSNSVYVATYTTQSVFKIPKIYQHLSAECFTVKHHTLYITLPGGAQIQVEPYMSDEYEGDKYPSEEGFEPADDYGIESDSESEEEEEEKESGAIYVGDIVDCPAAREIEALGLDWGVSLEVSK